jgi:hypothetical protein
MTAFFRHNGLTLALAGLFAFSLIGHAATGYASELEDLRSHGQSALSFVGYLASGAVPLLAVRELGERVPADVGLS